MQRTPNTPEPLPSPSLRARILEWIGVREVTRTEDDLRRALESAVGRIA